jgi:hypothetical protein
MKNLINITLSIVAIIIVIDVLGFMAWAMSGQAPVDGFYVGAITTNILRAIIL